MSEFLTTGQMIDRLKIGEVAVPNNKEYLAVKRIEDGFIWVDRNTHEQSKIHQDYFRIDRYTLDIKWSILPKYVSFEEAKVAYENGKIIGLHNDNSEKVIWFKKVNNKHLYSFNKENWSFSFVSLTWRDILEGKWTIEE
jgi:hypothetical protein